MITGPQQQRLAKALAGASDVAIGNGSIEWSRCAELLDNVADALDKAAAAEKTIGGQTGPAMAKAFRTSAEGMRGKSKELARGSEALGVASNAIMAAQVGQSEMDRYFPQESDPGTYHPEPGPQDKADLKAASDHQVLVEAFTGSYNARENIARQWADRIDTDFAESTKTMQTIHGEDFDEPTETDGPGSSTPPTTSSPPSTGRPPTRGSDEPLGRRDPEIPICTIGQPPVTTTVTPIGEPPVPVPTPLPPNPQPSGLPTVTEVPILDPVGTTTATPTHGGLVGPSIGAIAGGGLAGAALQGIRGGLFSSSSAGASSARPIGSSARAGAPGALGRGTASPGAAAGRGSGARTPGGGAGRGASGGHGAGGRRAAGGGAGARRGGKSAAGAGAAAGRRGGKDKDERGQDRDLFDDGQDWIDDADAAPGVID